MLRPKHDGALNWRRDIPLQPEKSFIKGRVIEAWGERKGKKTEIRGGQRDLFRVDIQSKSP